MKKTTTVLLVLTVLLFASEREAILSFVTGSLSAENYTHFGLSSQSEVGRLTLGESIEIYDVDSDSLKTYPASGIGRKSTTHFCEVVLDGIPQFLVLVDAEEGAVSMGYRQLALELIKMEKLFAVSSSEVTIYRATQINSFLFSVPSTGERSENLTVLRPGWEQRRALLADFNETVMSLRAGLGQ